MKAGTVSELSDLGHALAGEKYVRSRLLPSGRSPDCLILEDVLAVVRPFSRDVAGRILDYGCGGAPYRELFARATEYIGVDVAPGPRVDRLLREDGLTSEPEGSFDAVLSSQVLEHVPDPWRYLAECRRVMKPGGEILLSTHGMFHEHGCPHDYHRWTARGLECLFQNAGFEVLAAHKLTAQIRGACQLVHYFMDRLHPPADRTVWRLGCAAARRSYHVLGVPCLNWIGRRFPEFGVVPSDHPAAVYVGVAIHARKPAA